MAAFSSSIYRLLAAPIEPDLRIDDILPRVNAQQWVGVAGLRFAFSTIPVLLSVTMASGTLLIFLIRNAQSTGILGGWLALLATVSCIRAWHFLRFRNLSDRRVDVVAWRRRFVAGTLASGVVWGLAGLVLYPSGSLFHQVVLAFILAGVSAGALTAYSPIPRAYFSFVFPVVIPLAIRFLMEGGQVRYSMAALTLLFLSVVVRSSLETSRLIASVFATQAKNLELTEELHHQATHDSLVNLVNHGEFKRRLASVASALKLRHEPYALLFVDLDNFKTVNDTGGHAAGDEILQRVANTLRQHIRADDTAARVGGDEFVLLLQRCPKEQAARIAENILKSIASLTVGSSGKARLSASIGVAYTDAGEYDAETILRAADAACYAAKSGGRGRIEVYHSDPMYVASGRFEMDRILFRSAQR
jgi:diguanylate cyclase (GGDEF)-like protein